MNLSNPRTVIGVDLAFRAVGIFVVSLDYQEVLHHQLVTTEGNKGKKSDIFAANDDVRCAEELADAFVSVTQSWSPSIIAVETPTAGSKSSSAARMMGLATGVFVGALRALTRVSPTLQNTVVLHTTPNDTKRLTAASGAVTKAMVRDYVLQRWPTLDLSMYGTSEKRWGHVTDAAGAVLAIEDHSALKVLRSIQ